MRQVSFSSNGNKGLLLDLYNWKVSTDTEAASAVLVQIYVSDQDKEAAIGIAGDIRKLIPSAVIIGSTASGEIFRGETIRDSITVSVTLFEKTSLEMFFLDFKSGDEVKAGEQLGKHLSEKQDIAGVLLFGTSITLDISKFLQHFYKTNKALPVFGGCSGLYDKNKPSFIFSDIHASESGVAGVIFQSKELSVFLDVFAGWEPLSRELSVTDIADSRTIKTIEYTSAAEVFEKYLGIERDENFLADISEFPFIFERDGIKLIRNPIALDEDGSLIFAADIYIGERLQIGCGDVYSMQKHSKERYDKIRSFAPEAIYLYSSANRYSFLQEDTTIETKIYESVSSANGYYSFGEIVGKDEKISLMNSSLITVGLKENEKAGDLEEYDIKDLLKTSKSTSLIKRLIYFNKTVTEELRESNQKMKSLNETLFLNGITDEDTKMYNRKGMPYFSDRIFQSAQEMGNKLFVMAVDLDSLKYINDTFGHREGDHVISKLAGILKKSAMPEAKCFRMGGDEFMIIASLCQADEAPAKMSARIKYEINKFNRKQNLPYDMCASIGYIYEKVRPGTSLEHYIKKADQNMYADKMERKLSKYRLQNLIGEKDIFRNTSCKKPTILCVDDDNFIRKIMIGLLRDEYIVIEAADGKEALDVIENRMDIDLVLLDLTLPGMDGLEVLEIIRGTENRRYLPVIIITADIDLKTEEEGYNKGVDDFIRKPFNQTVVKHHIRNIIKMYQTQTKLEEDLKQKIVLLEHQAEKLSDQAKKLEQSE